ncbi:MAG: radical SAM protein [Phycisphaeraceae bacterium]
MPRAEGLAARRVTLMLKPVGAGCNLRCHYCYYLPTAGDGGVRRMGEGTLEAMLAGYLPRAGDAVTLSWQGGEPTLAGLAWFERMVELVERHRRPTQRVVHALQTNGTLLDERWCRFLREQKVLVGISMDGLGEDHDHYRTMADGSGSYERVEWGLRLLRRHGVEHNVLVVLSDRNVVRPLAVWRELMRLGVDWVQFIPAVEWLSPEESERAGRHDAGWSGGARLDDWRGWQLASFSPDAEAYGAFLCAVFDEWFVKHRTRVSVRVFDSVLQTLVHGVAAECTYSDSCSSQLTVEHDGTVYGCDHYVEPRWRLGDVGEPVALTVDGEEAERDEGENWWDRLDGERLAGFGMRKLALGAECRSCRWLRLCYGGCPKHRPARGGITGPTVLCAGYRRLFEHTMERFEWLAGYLKEGQLPPAQRPARIERVRASKPVKRRKKRSR